MKISNNKDRAKSAFLALEKFSRLTKITREDVDSQMIDLLCNLQHLADEQDIEFQECLEGAGRIYSTEVLQARLDEP
jgi:hypothetical protein